MPNRGGFAPHDVSGVDGCSNFYFAPDGSWCAFECIRLHSDRYVVEGLE